MYYQVQCIDLITGEGLWALHNTTNTAVPPAEATAVQTHQETNLEEQSEPKYWAHRHGDSWFTYLACTIKGTALGNANQALSSFSSNAFLKDFMVQEITIIKNIPYPGCGCSLSHELPNLREEHSLLWPHQPCFLESLTEPRTTVEPLSNWMLMISSPPNHSPMPPAPTHFCSLLTPTMTPFQGQPSLCTQPWVTRDTRGLLL